MSKFPPIIFRADKNLSKAAKVALSFLNEANNLYSVHSVAGNEALGLARIISDKIIVSAGLWPSESIAIGNDKAAKILGQIANNPNIQKENSPEASTIGTAKTYPKEKKDM